MKKLLFLSLIVLLATPAFSQGPSQMQNADEVVVSTTLELVRN